MFFILCSENVFLLETTFKICIRHRSEMDGREYAGLPLIIGYAFVYDQKELAPPTPVHWSSNL